MTGAEQSAAQKTKRETRLIWAGAAVVVVALIAIGGLLPSPDSSSDGAESELAAGDFAPDDRYLSACAGLLGQAGDASPAIEGADLVASPPKIIATSPLTRIQCAITTRRGQQGSVTGDVSCTRDLDRSCVSLVAATDGARTIIAR